MYYNNNYKAYEIDRRGFTALFRDEALPTAEEREEWAKISAAPIKTRYFILKDGNYKGELYAVDDVEASNLFSLMN